MTLPSMTEVGVFGWTFPSSMPLVGTYGWFKYIPQDDPFIPDHVNRSLALLIEQFEQTSPDLNALAAAFIAPFQEEEYVLYDLLTKRNIDDASGVQLDMIGEIVGESRNGRNDETYRTALRLRPILNKSHGEPETLILFLKTKMNTFFIHYYELHPAKVRLSFGSILALPSDLQTQIEAIAPAGVGIILTYINSDEPTFAFDGEGGFPPLPNTDGFSEYNYTEGGNPIGGQFVDIIT